MLRLRRRWVGALSAAVLVVVAAVAVLVERAEPIRILAVPELADLRPVLADFTDETGIPVELQVAETARITWRVARERPDVDAVWSHADHGSAGRRLAAGAVVVSSPVLLGLRESLAKELGWTGEGVGWEELAEAARNREFTFGMSSPESSFSGRAVVLAAATGLAGVTDALTVRDVHPAAGGLGSLASAQAFRASTDGGLTGAFLAEQGETADGIFTYESEIARLNASGRLAERLVPVRLRDGVIAARYALRPLLEPRTAGSLSRLTEYLLDGEVQERIARSTYRRPSSPGVALPEALAGPVPRLRGLPKDEYVVNRLVDAYLGRYRYDVRTLFLLDVSGSMGGRGMAALRRAASVLAEAPLTDSPRSGDVHFLFLPFASRPGGAKSVRLSAGEPEKGLRAVAPLLDGLAPGGGTAIYDALVAGYRELEKLPEEDRVVSIVLITDGRNGEGRGPADFLRFHAGLAPWLREVPVYPVLVGGSGLRELADRTGGRVLDARQDDLAADFLTSLSGR
ncbi:VWA domain-containing protein [Actinocorallia populi]|uniref:VWA domain-containing protein n=1 Tax=Actinocorallia populi TaxID=2079200 RepID=UPI000D0920C8|nr:VWA domain-containing protein [Actinocorallia populi]